MTVVTEANACDHDAWTGWTSPGPLTRSAVLVIRPDLEGKVMVVRICQSCKRLQAGELR